MKPFRFGVASNESLRAHPWRNLARKAEALGYSTLLTADHLNMRSTLARLVSAADATSTLRVGSYVLNNDFFHPLRLAQEVATVDELCEGRFEFGVGSGWARPEYERLGLAYDKPPERAARLESALAEIKRVWATQTDLGGAAGVPLPEQSPHPPVLVGGHSDAVLSVAGRHADIVGLTGATLVNGAYRPTGAAFSHVAQRVELVRSAAGDRFAELEFNVRVQVAFLVENAAAVTEKMATLAGVPPQVVAESPFALIGTESEIAAKLLALRDRLGLSYYVVSGPACEAFAPVVARLSGR